MSFFVRQKVQISSNILPQIPNFANFVKFRQKSIFSSRRPVFVISSVFRHKRNPLEPSYVLFIRAAARSAKRVGLLAIVILSVLLSRPGTDSSPGEIETPCFHRNIA